MNGFLYKLFYYNVTPKITSLLSSCSFRCTYINRRSVKFPWELWPRWHAQFWLVGNAISRPLPIILCQSFSAAWAEKTWPNPCQGFSPRATKPGKASLEVKGRSLGMHHPLATPCRTGGNCPPPGPSEPFSTWGRSFQFLKAFFGNQFCKPVRETSFRNWILAAALDSTVFCFIWPPLKSSFVLI